MERKANDEIRETILRFLYNKRKKARSLRSISSTTSELKRELKNQGLTENQIVTNLDFLIKNGWVEEQVERYTLPHRRIEVKKSIYRLTNVGLHYFEKSSRFDVTGRFSGMRFEDIRDSVIVVGFGNVVQKDYYELYSTLDALKSRIILGDLPEADKLDYLADVETIKTQLAKPHPEASIIRKAWGKICTLSKVAGLAGLIEKIYRLIEFFLK